MPWKEKRKEKEEERKKKISYEAQQPPDVQAASRCDKVASSQGGTQMISCRVFYGMHVRSADARLNTRNFCRTSCPSSLSTRVEEQKATTPRGRPCHIGHQVPGSQGLAHMDVLFVRRTYTQAAYCARVGQRHSKWHSM